MNIYIANLDSRVDDEQLKILFSPFGAVQSASVVKDVFTDASRGFGYIEMEEEPGKAAIGKLNGSKLHSLTLTVEEAPEKKEQKGSYKVGNGAVNVYRFKKN